MGHKALSKVQMGQEGVGTPGTAVAADFIWRGPYAGLKDARETEAVDEQIGVALKSSRKYASMLLAELSMPVTNLTPEQSLHIFEAAIKQINTGVADGAGSSGFVYAYNFGSTAINTISTYTIETGDETQAEEAEYCFVKSFTITAVKGESVQISAEWVGRQVVLSTFTAAQTAPAVTEIHSSAGTVYIDEPSGSIGTTAIAAGNIQEMTLNVTTGLVPVFTIDSGNLYFQGHGFDVDEFEASMEIKFLHDTAALAEKVAWRANTNRLYRVEFTGAAYGTPGASTLLGGLSGIQIDFPGSYESFSAIEFEDGKSVLTATLTGGYENESAESLGITVANEVAAVP